MRRWIRVALAAGLGGALVAIATPMLRLRRGGVRGQQGGSARAQEAAGPSMDTLVASLKVQSPRVRQAMRMVDRFAFIDERFCSKRDAYQDAYQDAPAPIGGGQTISAPHMHAIALDLLEPHLQPGSRVLDVGSGSGYLVPCFSLLVQPGGYVLGLEKDPDLAARSVRSIRKACPALADGWLVKHADALGQGALAAEEPPFNAIHVGAAADVVPANLVEKLARGGRMVVPVGPRYSVQTLMVIDKDAQGHVQQKSLMSVQYVPLTRPSELQDGYLP